MRRNLTRRALIMLALLAGMALLTVRKESTVSSAAPERQQADPFQRRAVEPRRARPFSQDYEYCYVDSDGRPMIVHRKKHLFFLPEPEPQVDDRTFIEGDECR